MIFSENVADMLNSYNHCPDEKGTESFLCDDCDSRNSLLQPLPR